MQLNGILVGVDEGALSRHAVARGVELAERSGASLELMHSVPMQGEVWSAVQAIDWRTVRERALEEARARCVERLGEWVPDPPAALAPLADRLVVVETKAGPALVERAERSGADLVVIGGHRRRPLLDLGGTARRVLHGCPCPVWVQPDAPTAPRTVLAPIDPLDHEPASLEWARDVAEAYGARVRVVHAYMPPVFDLEALHVGGYAPPSEDVRDVVAGQFEDAVAAVDWRGVDVEVQLVEDEGIPAVVHLAEEADLVALAAHGRSALSQSLLGSVTLEVLKRATGPVLAVPMAGD